MTKKIPTCEWKLVTVGDDEFYATECGSSWSFLEGDCEDNQVNYCFHCGKKIKEKACG